MKWNSPRWMETPRRWPPWKPRKSVRFTNGKSLTRASCRRREYLSSLFSTGAKNKGFPDRLGGESRSRQTFRFGVVIRCLLRPSDVLRRAMEVLNRSIGGAKIRDQTKDLRG